MLIRRRKEAQVSAYYNSIHSNGMSWIVKMFSKSCIRRDEEQEEKKSKYSNHHAGGQVSQRWIQWPKRWWKMKDLDGGQLARDTRGDHIFHMSHMSFSAHVSTHCQCICTCTPYTARISAGSCTRVITHFTHIILIIPWKQIYLLFIIYTVSQY